MKAFTIFVLLTLMFVHAADAQIKMGAIGDSLLDEHFDQVGFGANLGYSMNALELMVAHGRVDAGPKAGIAGWGDLRKTGFEYNWALAGSTTASMISDNQHTHLASQIASQGITKALIVVGANDLFPNPPTFLTTGFPGSTYEAVYEGLATTGQINALATAAVNNVVTAVQTLKSTGVDVVVATAPDYGIAPFTKFGYTDAVKRQRVADVLQLYNSSAIEQITNSLHVPVVDIYSLTKDVWGNHGAEKEFFKLGGVDFDLDGTGGVSFADVIDGSYDPNALTSDTIDAFVHDGIHPNSVIGGVFSNLFMTAFNQEYSDNFALFSEQEILQSAGPTLGGLYTGDTFQNSLGGKTYQDYVISAAAVAVAGDANGDGSFDFGDIEAFFLAITDLSAYSAQYPSVVISALDMNSDGNTDFGDIEAFFLALTAG